MKMPLLLALLLIAAAVAGCKTISASITSLEVGDCVKDDPGLKVTNVKHVDCDDEDAVRVAKIIQLSDVYDEFPGSDTLSALAGQRCPAISTSALYPTRETWYIATESQRRMYCFRSA